MCPEIWNNRLKQRLQLALLSSRRPIFEEQQAKAEAATEEGEPEQVKEEEEDSDDDKRKKKKGAKEFDEDGDLIICRQAAYTNLLPNALLATNGHPVRESDLSYSPFPSQSAATKYGNLVLSINRSTISMAEALKIAQQTQQTQPGNTIATGPALPQHLALFFLSTSTVFLFGNSTAIPGNYQVNQPAGPAGSTLNYDDVLNAHYKDNREILKLDPSYKVPPDYKPLLKEDRVTIPIKEDPAHNFIGLIFGPAGDTKKQLEKETGAKIQVYGTKAGTKKESEITSSDGNEVNGDYEKLYVLVTAETYEKLMLPFL
ncbi:hypothetical protein SSX86_007820 [Deinandra increscens subsp. villosa]|uniref:K Homology domain-containing protein n=1 Tax=Deinandra increscens subsp. villosa TaxID=3103831 RepID=A0AAP0DE54_9ASTR